MRIVRLLLILAAALLLAGTETRLGEAPGAEAAFPGTNGKIVFVASGAHRRIATIGSDGSGRIEVTDGHWPQWSPDGLKIAIERDGQIFVINEDGSENFIAAGLFPAWSPDGSRIAFIENLTGKVWLVGADGNGLQPVGVDASYLPPRWSPDGQWILFTYINQGNGDLFKVHPDGTGLTNITNTPTTRSEELGDWSPDGSRIVYREGGPSVGIYTMNADGSGRQLIQAGGMVPVWSPDGTKIAFESDIEGPISVMNADGSGATPVPNSAARLEGLDWQVQPDAISVEFTQAIQQLQTLSELQASLGDGSSATDVPASALTNANLDSFRGDDAEAKSFGPTLESGQQYNVTVVGTYSKWPASQWIDDGVCTGTPENSPMTPSPGATNGKVGLDAEWRFATPVGSSVCNEPAPDTDGSFQISVDGGSNFQNLTADNQGSGPNPAHKYEYTITGQGQIVAFRILDPDSSSSNYGKMLITVEAACENTVVTVWEEALGGNGHYYQGVCSSATWDETEAALESAGKHLATVTSGAENAFVYDLIDDAGFWSLAGDFCPGPFIGGNQTPGSPEPSGGWTWVTGEPFGYTNWAQDEPGDSDFSNENRLAFGRGDCGPQVTTAPVWHDVEGNESGVHSYVAEWDGEPVTVEFTQAIQELQPIGELQADLEGDGQPPVPMIAGKPAAMRVYFAEVEDTTHYVVQVSGIVSRTQQVTLDQGCTPTDRRRQDAGCSSVDFFFTPPEGSWSLTLDVRDFGGTTILNEEFHLTSVKTKPLNIVAVPVCDGSGCGLASDVARAIGLLRATYPGTVNVSFASGGNVTRPTTTGDGDWWNAVLADLVAMRAADGVTGDVYYHGAVRTGAGGFTPATGGILGMGFRPGVAAATRFNVSVTDISGASSPADQQVIAHEVGHNLGREHVPTVAGTACYGTPDPNSLDAGWPHPNPLIAEVGFDVANAKAKREDQFTDIMAYCLPGWTSVYNYTSLMDSVTVSPGPAAAAQGQAAGEFWEVSGSINGLSAVLNPIFDVDTTASTGAGSGSYRIEVRDGNGGLLFTRMFQPSESHWPGIAELESFFELIPAQTGAAELAVFDPFNTLLVERDLTGSAPVVEFGDVVLTGGNIEASWSLTDADSSSHAYRLEYSTDGGATWHILIPHLDGPNVELDASTLPGSSQMQLRVQASDGAATSEATSETFAVPEHGPEAEIISPASGTFRAGQLVPLLAAAFDADDGTLDDTGVSWSSSLDGGLGTGASLPVYDLSSGQHTITMTARDSDNNTVTDSITLTVFDGPIVEAGAVADIDCNGDVGAPDALALLYHLSGLNSDSCKTIGAGEPIAFGDANCDGVVGLPDVLAMLQVVADVPSGCTSAARSSVRVIIGG